jgi:ribosomal protein L2
MTVRAVPLLACAAIAAAGALAAPGARAETVVVNDQVSVRESSLARPHRGMRMDDVEHQFGAPETKHPTVGKPPITRWDYAQFSVFFEGDRVIHTVVAGDHAPKS